MSCQEQSPCVTYNESLYLFVKNPCTASLRLKALDSQTSKGTGTGTGTVTGVDHVIGAGAIAVKDLQVGGCICACVCCLIRVECSVRIKIAYPKLPLIFFIFTSHLL